MNDPNAVHIIPEEVVSDRDSAVGLAERMLVEARVLWASDRAWRQDVAGSPETGVPMIESRTIKGPLASTLVRMWRGTVEVAASADRTIRFLASKDGYCVLDTISKPEDLCKPVETYEWRPGSVLQIEHAFMKIPTMNELSFVVLNALDAGEEKFFLSKSCLHRSLRGHSAYAGHLDEAGGPPEDIKIERASDRYNRALNTFALLVSPHPTDPAGRCVVRLANWIELNIPRNCMHDALDITNRLNKRYFAPMFQRLAAGLAELDARGLEAPERLGSPFTERSSG